MCSKKVVIVGAGPAGLVAGKEALECGLEVTILEKADDLGGLWNPHSGSMWNSLLLNISKFSCAYSGFPWPKEAAMFPTGLEMYHYLKNYAEHFAVLPLIRFSCNVVQINKAVDSWEVEWSNERKEQQKQIFDAVIVACGIFTVPFVPVIPGMKSFKGTVLHSQHYKEPSSFKGQNVLVIGGSFSGAEVAADIALTAAKVYHNFHQPFWNVKRFLPRDPKIPHSTKIPVDFLHLTRKILTKFAASPSDAVMQRNAYLESLCPTQYAIQELKIDKEQFNKAIKVTRSDMYELRYAEGKVTPVMTNITKFEENKVFFDDGKESLIDSVVLCTGFLGDVSFLGDDIKKTLQYDQSDPILPLILYHYILHPDLPNLTFVGVQRGELFVVMELQARLVCQILSGKTPLPSRSQLNAGLDDVMSVRVNHPRPFFSFKSLLQYIDDTAALIGCYPDLDQLKKENATLFEQFMNTTLSGAQFRIDLDHFTSNSELNEMSKAIEQL